jgi:hypothetical protein
VLAAASEVLRQLSARATLQAQMAARQQEALAALQEAVARHGLHELQVYLTAYLAAVKLKTIWMRRGAGAASGA